MPQQPRKLLLRPRRLRLQQQRHGLPAPTRLLRRLPQPFHHHRCPVHSVHSHHLHGRRLNYRSCHRDCHGYCDCFICQLRLKNGFCCSRNFLSQLPLLQFRCALLLRPTCYCRCGYRYAVKAGFDMSVSVLGSDAETACDGTGVRYCA